MNQQFNQWEKLDNQACSALSNQEAQKINKKGVLYILRAQDKDVDDSDKNEDSIVIIPEVTAVPNQFPHPSPTRPIGIGFLGLRHEFFIILALS